MNLQERVLDVIPYGGIHAKTLRRKLADVAAEALDAALIGMRRENRVRFISGYYQNPTKRPISFDQAAVLPVKGDIGAETRSRPYRRLRQARCPECKGMKWSKLFRLTSAGKRSRVCTVCADARRMKMRAARRGKVAA